MVRDHDARRPRARAATRRASSRRSRRPCCAARSTWPCTRRRTCPASCPRGSRSSGVPERADPRDALCGADVARGAAPRAPWWAPRSLRRRSQLLALRPDLDVRDVRGNVDTRLRQAGGRRLRRARAGGRGAGAPRPGRGRADPRGRDDARAGPGLPGAGGREPATTRRAAAAERVTDRGALVELTAERALVTALERDLPHAGGRACARWRGSALALDAYAGLPDGSAWVRDAARRRAPARPALRSAAPWPSDAAAERARCSPAGRRRLSSRPGRHAARERGSCTSWEPGRATPG